MQKPRDFSFSQYKQLKSSHYHYTPPPQSSVQTRARLDFFWNFFNACFDLFDCGVVLYKWCLTHFVLLLSHSVSIWVISNTVLFSNEFYSTLVVLFNSNLDKVRIKFGSFCYKKDKIKQNRTVQMNLKQDNPFIGKFNKKYLIKFCSKDKLPFTHHLNVF